MYQILFAILSLAGAGHVGAPERNFTIRGDGYLDPTGPGYRVALHEARLTLRDNREFLATLFARGERILVRGHWDRAGNSAVERIEIIDAFGSRADGKGTLLFSNDGRRTPVRLTLEGRTRQGRFRADIRDDDNDRGGWRWRRDPREDERRDRGSEIGEGDRVYRNIDADAPGRGLIRMSGIRDGRFGGARVRLGTGRDAIIDTDAPTRGTIRGRITDVRGDRVSIRVASVHGREATGELVATFTRDHDVARLDGSGTGEAGSWQLEFAADGRGNADWPDGNGPWRGGVRSLDATTPGSGNLSQDFGPSLGFDRIRVHLGTQGEATVALEGRGQDMRFAGGWTERSYGDVITIDLTSANELAARGRFELRLDGRDVASFGGDGRTDCGGFRVTFRGRQ